MQRADVLEVERRSNSQRYDDQKASDERISAAVMALREAAISSALDQWMRLARLESKLSEVAS